jgi:hypothetical protein
MVHCVWSIKDDAAVLIFEYLFKRNTLLLWRNNLLINFFMLVLQKGVLLLFPIIFYNTTLISSKRIFIDNTAQYSNEMVS